MTSNNKKSEENQVATTNHVMQVMLVLTVIE